LLAVALWALAPAIVHLTVAHSNPFHFNLIVIGAETGLLIVLLRVGAKSYFQEPLKEIYGQLRRLPTEFKRLSTYLSYFKSSKTDDSIVSLNAMNDEFSKMGITPLVSVVRLPLIWAMIGTLHYGFFAWSTQYIETAIATTIYETWPFFLILFMTRHHSVDEAYRFRRRPTNTKRGSVGGNEVAILAVSAAIGVALISVSQHHIVTVDLLSWENIRGMFLATVASVLHALWIAGTLIYGKIIYYRVVEPASIGSEDAVSWSMLPVNERSNAHRRLLLWLTVMGIVVARLATLPVTLILGGLLFSHNGLSLGFSLTTRGLIGGITLGIVGALSAALRRYGDISASGPGIHALAFLTPPLSLVLLWQLGIDLPQRDIFVIGAVLIIASNILIQSRPDQHRDLSQFGVDDSPSRGRLGFKAFILSIWIFGTIIYTRDDILPKMWLDWKPKDYWALVALSATVFALILGFRVVRLAAQIDQEDDIMVRLFRDCEHLARRKHMCPDAIDNLRLLDMTRVRELSDAYSSLRTMVRNMFNVTMDREDYSVLRDVETNLDRLCHIKQQGRDIVELISLSAFALATIGIALFSRPAELRDVGFAWSAFISESFALIFVSTIAFLWVNLFDMRRDRSIPTLVPIHKLEGDNGVFFRYDRDLRVKHIAAVSLSAAMAGTFVLLLYDKWLSLT